MKQIIEESADKTVVLRVVVARTLVFTLFALAFCVLVIYFGANAKPGLYLIPFVISLTVLDYMHKSYKVKAREVITKYYLIFLLIYFLIYSWLFLNINKVVFEPSFIINIVFGHCIYFFFAYLVANFYAKLRLRKQNKKSR